MTFCFNFSGQTVECFETEAEAIELRDAQEAFWLSRTIAERNDDLGWDDVSDEAIREACTISAE